jgi:hypothetical protein
MAQAACQREGDGGGLRAGSGFDLGALGSELHVGQNSNERVKW